MQTLFLINPGSGKRKNPAKTAELIHEIYGRAGLAAQTAFIDFPSLDECLQQALEAGVRNVFAVGGDGTVNAIAARLIDKQVNFGVIPKGSGNGFARNLGFSINTRLAIKQSMDSWSIKIDTGSFNDTPFVNVAGVGLDAVVAEIFAHKKKRGFSRYVRSSAEGLMSYRPEAYQIDIDGEELFRENIMAIAIANGTQWGYDAKISPQARLTDGLLDVIIVKHFPLIGAGGLIGRLFNGQIYNSRYVEVRQGKHIRIVRQAPGSAQVDGEPFEAGKEISIRVKEKSLNLLVPNTLTYKKIQSL